MMSHPNSPGISPRKGKYLDAKVLMLDDNVEIFHVPTKALGMALFGEVVRKMQLLEADYFDLEFNDQQGSPCWLDHEKAILKQVSAKDAQFKFLVKFYGPDPGLLEEEYTRYLFALQVRRDLATGAMLCQEHTAVLLASYVVQAEIGDFDEDEYQDGSYLRHLKLLPHQSVDIEKKIMEHHKEHIGQTPAEAEFNLLDTARKVEMYGIRMHPAKDHEGVSLNLAIAHMGVLVFQHLTRINTFSWAKIRKLSFKRKKFLIKLHPEGYGYYKDTVEFYFDTRDECKNFWKKCIEHHAFFRCQRVKRQSRNRTRVVSRGSSFRYCGRTQKQLTEFVRENYQKRPAFERSQSMRAVSSSSVPRRTPNSSTLNSREMSHYGHNTTMSSHSLDRRSERNIMTTSSHSATTPLTVQQRLEMSAEIHDDSSGSRSPRKRLDMHLGDRSGSEEWNHYDVQEASERADKILREPGGQNDHFNYNYYQLSYTPDLEGNMINNDNSLPPGYYQDQRNSSEEGLDNNQNANDNDDHVSNAGSYNLSEDYAERSDNELLDDSTELHIDENDYKSGGGSRHKHSNERIRLNSCDEVEELRNDVDILESCIQEVRAEFMDPQSSVYPSEEVNQFGVLTDNIEQPMETNLDEIDMGASQDSYERVASEHSQMVIMEAVNILETEANNEGKDVDHPSYNDVEKNPVTHVIANVEIEIKDALPVEDDESKVTGVDTNGHAIMVGNGNIAHVDDNSHDTKTNEEIPYILHRRHIEQHSRRPASHARHQHILHNKPVRQKPTPDEEKIQMQIITSSLVSPIPSVPSRKSPRDKSPSSRTFDMAKLCELPAADSFSATDDTMSPSQEEKLIIAKMESFEKELEKPKNRGVSFDDHVSEIEIPAVERSPMEDGMREMAMMMRDVPKSRSYPETKPGLLPPKASVEDLTPTTESDSEESDRDGKRKSLQQRRERNKNLSPQRLSSDFNNYGSDSSSCGGSTQALNLEAYKQQPKVFRLSKEDIPFADDDGDSSEPQEVEYKRVSVVQKRVRPEDIAVIGSSRSAPVPPPPPKDDSPPPAIPSPIKEMPTPPLSPEQDKCIEFPAPPPELSLPHLNDIDDEIQLPSPPPIADKPKSPPPIADKPKSPPPIADKPKSPPTIADKPKSPPPIADKPKSPPSGATKATSPPLGANKSQPRFKAASRERNQFFSRSLESPPPPPPDPPVEQCDSVIEPMQSPKKSPKKSPTRRSKSPTKGRKRRSMTPIEDLPPPPPSPPRTPTPLESNIEYDDVFIATDGQNENQMSTMLEDSLSERTSPPALPPRDFSISSESEVGGSEEADTHNPIDDPFAHNFEERMENNTSINVLEDSDSDFIGGLNDSFNTPHSIVSPDDISSESDTEIPVDPALDGVDVFERSLELSLQDHEGVDEDDIDDDASFQLLPETDRMTDFKSNAGLADSSSDTSSDIGAAPTKPLPPTPPDISSEDEVELPGSEDLAHHLAQLPPPPPLPILTDRYDRVYGPPSLEAPSGSFYVNLGTQSADDAPRTLMPDIDSSSSCSDEADASEEPNLDEGDLLETLENLNQAEVLSSSDSETLADVVTSADKDLELALGAAARIDSGTDSSSDFEELPPSVIQRQREYHQLELERQQRMRQNRPALSVITSRSHYGEDHIYSNPYAPSRDALLGSDNSPVDFDHGMRATSSPRLPLPPRTSSLPSSYHQTGHLNKEQ